MSGKRQWRRWSPDEVDLLCRRYPDEDTALLAAELGRDVNRVYAKAGRLGLQKSALFRAALQAAGAQQLSECQFTRGSAPWNKGRSGTYTIAAGGGRGRTFQPGNKPTNYRAVGSEVWRSDGHVYRKVSDELGNKNCRPVYLLLWESHHGPVPKGHAVVFRDGDYRNITLDNLELVSRTELMRRNTVHRYPDELKSVIRLKSRLTRIIHQQEKCREKQD